MKEISWKQYVANSGYKPIKVWKNQNGFYAKIKGWASTTDKFTQVLSGGTTVRLSNKDVDNNSIVGKDIKVVFDKKNTIESKLKETIRRIVKELQDEELDEISTTGGVSGYNTPRAFKKASGNNPEEEPDTKYINMLNTGTGYKKVNENRYYELRKSEGTPVQKIGVGIREIKNKLTEMERFVTWYGRIKNENDVNPSDYWLRTQKNLSTVAERIKELSERVRQLSK